MNAVRMKDSDVTPAPNHSNTPRSSGRHPTSFNVAREIPLPIRKSVAVRPRRPSLKNVLVAVGSAGRYVFARAASTKKRMNHGNWMRGLSLPGATPAGVVSTRALKLFLHGAV